MERQGAIDLDACVARLIVLHNPHAAVAIPLAQFGGPHDTQWSIFEDEAATHYGPVAEGRLSWERPNVLCEWYAEDER